MITMYLWPMLRWHPLRSVPLPEVSRSHSSLRCTRSWWWWVERPPYWISFNLGRGEWRLVFSVPTMERITMGIFHFMEVSRRIRGKEVKTTRWVRRWGDWGSLSWTSMTGGSSCSGYDRVASWRVISWLLKVCLKWWTVAGTSNISWVWWKDRGGGWGGSSAGRTVTQKLQLYKD